MAEYSMTYEEFGFEIDKVIAAIPQEAEKERVKAHKAEILAAFTSDFSEGNMKDVTDAVELWRNQIKNRSELLFKTTYIPVHEIMFDLVKIMLTSGFIDTLMQCVLTDESVFAVSACSSIALEIWKHISDVKRLNDWDFCIYFQAMTHFREFKEFSMADLIDWLPKDSNKGCNMHHSQWLCSYRNTDDTCGITGGDRIEKAIASLVSKGILKKTQVGEDKWLFQFKK